ncbi:hypothetical protein [Hydrogenobacter thermophilus]|uniref:hypothetical protein n=1 Tax=Hydrogenobacter thermophilus TaxID=940 RepID=UPI0030F5930D
MPEEFERGLNVVLSEIDKVMESLLEKGQYRVWIPILSGLTVISEVGYGNLLRHLIDGHPFGIISAEVGWTITNLLKEESTEGEKIAKAVSNKLKSFNRERTIKLIKDIRKAGYVAKPLIRFGLNYVVKNKELGWLIYVPEFYFVVLPGKAYRKKRGEYKNQDYERLQEFLQKWAYEYDQKSYVIYRGDQNKVCLYKVYRPLEGRRLVQLAVGYQTWIEYLNYKRCAYRLWKEWEYIIPDKKEKEEAPDIVLYLSSMPESKGFEGCRGYFLKMDSVSSNYDLVIKLEKKLYVFATFYDIPLAGMEALRIAYLRRGLGKDVVQAMHYLSGKLDGYINFWEGYEYEEDLVKLLEKRHKLSEEA